MTEKCTDPLDMANQTQTQANDNAIAARRRAVVRAAQLVQAARDDGAFNGTDCVVCDDRIPDARLAMNVMQCVACATAAESHRRRMRG